MKTPLNIDTFGIDLYYDEDLSRPYIAEFADTYAPTIHRVKYETLEDALGDIVDHIIDPEEVYSMEEQPEDLQRAYALAGVPKGLNPYYPKSTEAVKTFLLYVLDGIIKSID